ncbi:MAG: hypothetical protein ISN29_02155 [Gammaproteobacteria bacterium AqS3]|nr:hypothetical protein [Gammaproteobacteria bacterium AqS3]
MPPAVLAVVRQRLRLRIFTLAGVFGGAFLDEIFEFLGMGPQPMPFDLPEISGLFC